MTPPSPPEGGNRLPVLTSKSAETALDIIRTETILSRLPVHNLSKKGNVNIRILKTGPTGHVELRWEVSFNQRYGEARQLAYKLDTLVINKRIDEARRPLPKILRLGSLNEICIELGLAANDGTNTRNLKRAFRQNAAAIINATLNYKGTDGVERHVEAIFTRYMVVLTGESLPNGQKADAVYIVFNELSWDVLNNAPVRPLDRAYMRELQPASQRFYEIISYKFYPVIKHKLHFAKMAYSEYCLLSAQQRSSDWGFVRPQMYQIHRPHLLSGYLEKPIRHEKTVDEEGKPDWMFYYVPGPRAHAEYAIHHPGHRLPKALRQPKKEKPAPPPAAPPAPTPTQHGGVDVDILVAEFGRRGIGETEARQILARCPAGQPVLDQLEHADLTVNNPNSTIKNPAGFYRSRVEGNFVIPASYETRAQRQAREEEERRRLEEELERQRFQESYWEYREAEVNRCIAAIPAGDFEQRMVAAVQRLRKQPTYQHAPESIVRSYALRDVRFELAERIPMVSFDDYCDRERKVKT